MEYAISDSRLNIVNGYTKTHHTLLTQLDHFKVKMHSIAKSFIHCNQSLQVPIVPSPLFERAVRCRRTYATCATMNKTEDLKQTIMILCVTVCRRICSSLYVPAWGVFDNVLVLVNLLILNHISFLSATAKCLKNTVGHLPSMCHVVKVHIKLWQPLTQYQRI